MVAKAGEKESLPAKVRIGIVSVNDELPVIVNNTGLTLWQGGSYVLTSSHLGKFSIYENYFINNAYYFIT